MTQKIYIYIYICTYADNSLRISSGCWSSSRHFCIWRRREKEIGLGCGIGELGIKIVNHVGGTAPRGRPHNTTDSTETFVAFT